MLMYVEFVLYDLFAMDLNKLYLNLYLKYKYYIKKHTRSARNVKETPILLYLYMNLNMYLKYKYHVKNTQEAPEMWKKRQ